MTGWKWIATGIALALGVAGVWRAVGSPERDERRQRLAERAQRNAAEAHAATPEEEIAALREALALERETRLALEVELAELRARAEQAEARGAGAPAPGPEPAVDAAGSPAAAPAAGAGAALASAPELPAELAPEAGPAGNRRFDERKLEAFGLAPGEAERLRERFEQAQMDELYLRDQAAREGWLRRPRFQMARHRLQRELREEVGDESYDLMLYASGEPNRVQLAYLLDPSPGRAAGLQDGDVLLRYDGRRIFTGQELQNATRSARRGSQVAVDVLRGGEEIRVYLPAGPVGAQLEPTTLLPER
jgi:hypothetical protein